MTRRDMPSTRHSYNNQRHHWVPPKLPLFTQWRPTHQPNQPIGRIRRQHFHHFPLVVNQWQVEQERHFATRYHLYPSINRYWIDSVALLMPLLTLFSSLSLSLTSLHVSGFLLVLTAERFRVSACRLCATGCEWVAGLLVGWSGGK